MTYTPDATKDCVFQVNGVDIAPFAFAPDDTKDCVFQVNGVAVDPARSYVAYAALDCVFQVNGTSAVFTPDAALDCVFQVNGSSAAWTPDASKDCVFQVNGAGQAWVPQSTDCVFQVNGVSLVSSWRPSPSTNLTLTVNSGRHLMLFEQNIKRMEASKRADASLTLRKLRLTDTQDTNTGWYGKTYIEETIKGSISPKGVAIENLTVGKTTKYELTLSTNYALQPDDEIVDKALQTYTVDADEEYWHLDKFSHYQASLTKRTPYPERPATSGTWSTTEQAQIETRNWLLENLTAANITKDNGAVASYIVTLGKADYSPEHVFFTKNVDAIISVEPSSVDQAGEYENVPVTIYTVNKSGITAANLQWKIEAELRRIAAASPLGLYRSFLKVSPDQTVDTRIKSATYNLAYYPSVTATHYKLNLGTLDATTGWPQRVYTASTIKLLVKRRGSTVMLNGVFRSAKYNLTGYTPTLVAVGDELELGTKRFKVHAVESEYYLGTVSHYICDLEQRDLAQAPDTSGTWHLDGSSAKTDPRYRQKTYLETYLTANNMKLDNATTNAKILICFSNADLPLHQIFTTLAYDGVITIGKDQAEALYDFNHKPYAFVESVPISIYAVNKAGLTASNLIEQIEQEIRRITTTYPAVNGSSIRKIETIRNPEPIDVGGEYLYSTTVTFSYKRSNDDYTGSGITITWGPSATPTGTYEFPNITYRSVPAKVNNTNLDIIRRMGSITQKLGAPDYIVTIKADLDMEPANKTWRRAQSSASKTDTVNWQAVQDIFFNGQYDTTQAYQTLKLYGSTIPVTVEEVTPEETENGWVLTMKLCLYSATSGTAYKTWFGIT